MSTPPPPPHRSSTSMERTKHTLHEISWRQLYIAEYIFDAIKIRCPPILQRVNIINIYIFHAIQIRCPPVLQRVNILGLGNRSIIYRAYIYGIYIYIWYRTHVVFAWTFFAHMQQRRDCNDLESRWWLAQTTIILVSKIIYLVGFLSRMVVVKRSDAFADITEFWIRERYLHTITK